MAETRRFLQFWSVMAAHTLARGPVAMAHAARGNRAGVEAQQVGWARAQMAVAGVTATLEGAEHLTGTGPYVVLSNHASNFDPVVLFATLPIGMTYVAKQELRRVPIFGTMIAHTGAVFVDRGNSQAAIAAMHVAADRVRNGQNVLVFPEGHRSRDGHLQAFKKGGFLLAIEAGVPLLPVVLHGTFGILPPGAKSPHSGHIRVQILPPVATTGLTPADRDALVARVHADMAAALGESAPT